MRTSIAVLLLLFTMSLPAFAKEDSVFDKIIKTGVIKCGYYVFPPVTYRDPNTGELSGLSVDIMNAIAKQASLKVEWTEEVNFGNWVPALQGKRFDLVCTPMWSEIPMSRVVAFTTPMFYAGLSPFIKADNPKFSGNGLEQFNKKDVVFVTQDGNAIDIVTREAFPNATVNPMPTSMDGPTILQEIITGKADVILLDKNAEVEYNRNNPVKLKLVATDKPVKIQSFNLVVGRDELILKDFLDNAIKELQNSGSMDRMITKWEAGNDLYLRAAPSYATPKN